MDSSPVVQAGPSAGQPRQIDRNANRPLPELPSQTDSPHRKRRVNMYEDGRTYPYRMSPTHNPATHTQEDLAARILPQFRISNTPTMSDIVGNIPVWQPDEDVQKCPVCDQEFGIIFFRKHHCRRCGQVVCGDCSKHRITVPLRYIAQPPWAAEGGTQYLSGSAAVRVCNPCVPDPWRPVISEPPPVPPPDTRPRSTNRYSLPPAGPSPTGYIHRHTGSLSNPPPYDYRPQPQHNIARRPVAVLPNQERLPGPDDILRFSGTPARPIQPVPPRKVVKEEDECPVCGVELPPGESLREVHISGCVMTRFGGDTARATPPQHEVDESQASSSDPTAATRARAQSYRSRGLYQYKATEKDCIDGDGQEQECPICFEEFQPGETLGRLECLCRFHHTCIREWWVRKGPGMCPVHASHE